MLTLNILLDALSRYTPRTLGAEGASVSFAGFRHFYPDSPPPDPNYLYFCSPADLESAREGCPDVFFLVTEGEDGEVPGGYPPHAVILSGTPGPQPLYEEISFVFERIAAWDHAMMESILANEGLQGLLDLCEPIIGNHIAISDPSLKMLAYTKGIAPIDPISKNLIQYGYHPTENIKGFKARRAFERWAKNSDIVFTEHREDGFFYLTALKSFKSGGTYSVLVVMTFSNRPCTPGILDLFEMLYNRIGYYVYRDYPQKGNHNYALESLFVDLVEHRIRNRDSISDRCEFAGIHFAGTFAVMKITWQDKSNIPLQRVLDEVLTALPQAKGIAYQNDLLVLNIFPKSGVPGKQATLDLIDALRPILKRYGGFCGISSFFQQMIGMASAYEQSDIALRYGLRLMNRDCSYKHLVFTLPLESDGFFKYENYYFYHLINSAFPEKGSIAERVPGVGYLAVLSQYDREHNTNLTLLLYSYLLAERRATVVSELLHMHRNSVLYQIERIEALLEIDLDDPDLRFNLMTAFKFHELYSSAE